MAQNVSYTISSPSSARPQITFVREADATISVSIVLPRHRSTGERELSQIIEKTPAEMVADGALTSQERTALLAVLAQIINFYRTASSLDP